jgi:membrane fusion protein, copper/silver efflux system
MTMKTSRYVIVLLAVATIAFLAGSLQIPRQAVKAAAVEVRTPLYYHCPMHPDYKSDKPGTAPCCGMALEPVYAEVPSAIEVPFGSIVVSAAKQQVAGVRVAPVERAGGVAHLRLFGRVTPQETRIFRLYVGLDGYIRDIAPVTTGSQVRRNQWLASFSTPESRQPMSAYVQSLDVLDREMKLASGAQQIAAAVANKQVAIDRLLTTGMSPVQIDEMAQTRVVAPTIKVTSPVDGFVVARNVSAGEKFDRGTELFRIADLHHVWILADVPAADVQYVKPGMTATIRVGGRSVPIHARVSSDLLAQFDPATQSMKVRVEAENPEFLLRPDMFVDVDVEVPYPPSILVPAEAIIASGLRNSVFVERTAGVFEARDVEVGRQIGTRVAIERGLEPFERIAVSGTFLLDSESRMKSHDQPHH